MPILVVYGDETPRKSRTEMDALAELPNVQVKRLAKGKLAIHEECPNAVAAAVQSFLS
ncbi:alpha/beta hydrolase [Mesorhizobium sp. M0622]|uniref:alpha/beta fold hydrolase n=1 Tax=Mesorhizobium sp. M0622 TaxID=2956975 RepID=UPI00333DEC4D